MSNRLYRKQPTETFYHVFTSVKRKVTTGRIFGISRQEYRLSAKECDEQYESQYNFN